MNKQSLQKEKQMLVVLPSCKQPIEDKKNYKTKKVVWSKEQSIDVMFEEARNRLKKDMVEIQLSIGSPLLHTKQKRE